MNEKNLDLKAYPKRVRPFFG